MESNIHYSELTIFQKLDITNEILGEGFIKLSFDYAKCYESNPQNFMRYFKTLNVFSKCCAWIVWSYKRIKAFQECEEFVKQSGKDFTAWCNKQDLSDKEKKILNDILIIIYSVTKNK